MSSIKNNKGFVEILILIFAVTIIGAGGYFWYTKQADNESDENPTPTSTTTQEATPTPDTYEGWQTYTDEEYGFSIKYPATWFNRSPEGELPILSYSNNPEQLTVIPLDTINFYINNQGNENLSELDTELFYETLSGLNTGSEIEIDNRTIKVTKLASKNIDSKQLLTIHVQTGSNPQFIVDNIQYRYMKNSRIFVITNHIAESNQQFEVSEKIISSLEIFD